MKLCLFTTFFFFILCPTLQAKSCLSFFETAEKIYDNQFAQHFEIKRKSNLILIQKSDQAYRVFYQDIHSLPPECVEKSLHFVDSIIPTSTSMLHFFTLLGKEEVIQAFPGTRYITSPTLQKELSKD